MTLPSLPRAARYALGAVLLLAVILPRIERFLAVADLGRLGSGGGML